MTIPARRPIDTAEWWRSVLVIDDKRSFNFDCAYARTVQAATSLLEDEWYEVWLDYDLDQGTNVEPVLAWITERIGVGRRPVITEVVIHTSNSRGAAVIADALSPHYQTRRVGLDELQQRTAGSSHP